MNIVNKKIGELKPYENNPRHNENAVPYVVESIKRYGFKNPIIIDKDNVIVAGHTRYLASKELGLNEVPCIVADDLTEDEIKEFRLVDNRTAEMSDWDDELLASELSDIDFGDFDFGFDVEEIEDIEEIDRKGNMAQKFLIPPFSVIQGNKGDWLSRKKKWIDFGIRSEVGRAGNLLSIEGAIERQTSYTIGGAERAKAFKNNEKLNSYMRK